MVSKHIIVSGKVQGVWYRASAKQKADALRLTGSIANLANGTVEIYVEGEDADVDRLISWCKKGPEHARVEVCEINPSSPLSKTSFEILR